MASSQRSSRRSRPIRSSRTKVQSYHEESSSDAGANETDNEGSEDALLAARPRRSNRRLTSYRESSSDGSIGEGNNDEEVEGVVSIETTTRFPYQFSEPAAANTDNPSRTRRHRREPRQSRTTRSRSKRELGRPLKKRQKVVPIEIPFIGSGVIPPWQTLPYHILFDIFYRASYPLIDEQKMERSNSAAWLVDMSLMCRAFHEPALAVLYYSPPLLPAAKCHSLLSLLGLPQESLSTNYVNKIKELHVDAEHLLMYKSGPSLGYFDLAKLVERAPRTKNLQIYHKDDYQVGLAPWQKTLSRWNYTDAFFTALNNTPIMLRSWAWNGRFMETSELLVTMLENHQKSAFRGVRALKLLHISAEYTTVQEASPDTEPREVFLADALAELPELHHLEFMECSIVNAQLLPNLPSRLTSLTIINCDEVTTSNLGEYLLTHGHNLRELVLNHNRHLSMSFLTGFAQSCSRLETFKMDLSIHDRSSYHDVELHFDELISPSEIPSWPATLKDIELTQLRNWGDTAAEVFFASLTDAAPELPNLRRLVISAILQIGWRDRATFREKWIGKLRTVFLRRRSPSPNPALRSIRRAPLPSGQLGVRDDTPAEQATHSDVYTANEAGSVASTPSKRHSARLAERKLSEVEDHFQSSHVRKSDSPSEPVFIQGLCDVVSIRIDNQRPSELQFNENDFLDDELSGDEDWAGYDHVVEERHAW
ncbi:hypothetical protein ASPZODRAFT_136452 [Penicilliopsis zonata CBS 506.65]|uniref:Uncharacterized protein n=1 Tax=Penicilliopsis zonata CBS 506.65 TaxID=1073090 RepID=A0A1L9S7W6_9EURO|nr:hypothetical protein ASPZODRAFT_136452 [Penicilliopsis zonata CBS 506.65]OJJ43245.1 hypothetical protein ASPZODRAFT_136452 [Penicilliopsis zonata CBS 506.65]